MSLIEQFRDVVGSGISDDDVIKWLTAADFDIETSVALYLASQQSKSPSIPSNKRNKSKPHGNKRMNSDIYDEEGVRIPDEVKQMRLLGNNDDFSSYDASSDSYAYDMPMPTRQVQVVSSVFSGASKLDS